MSQEKVIEIQEQEKYVLIHKANSLLSQIKLFISQIKNNDIGVEDSHQLLKDIENVFCDLCSFLQYDSNFDNDKFRYLHDYTDRQLLILEEKLKQQEQNNNSSENELLNVPEQIKYLAKKLNHFWDEQGFNYIRSIKITEYGSADIEFAFAADLARFNSDKPISSKEIVQTNIENLKNKGYVFCTNDKDLLDCDTNKNLLTHLFKEFLPSATIWEWNTYVNGKNRDEHRIKNVRVRIKSVKEILNLHF
jgi:hypothetical protein